MKKLVTKEKETNLKEKEKAKRIKTLLVDFFVFAGDSELHRYYSKEEEVMLLQIHRFLAFHEPRGVNPHTSSSGGMWNLRAAIVSPFPVPCSSLSKLSLAFKRSIFGFRWFLCLFCYDLCLITMFCKYL